MAFRLNEYCDMYMIFGECHGRARRAAELYSQLYPERQHPTYKVFLRLDQRMRENGCVMPAPRIDAGRNRLARNVRNEERILQMVTQNPTTSIRRMSHQLGLSRMIVHRVLSLENMHPYHYRKVQKLLPQDYAERVQFCQWLLNKVEADNTFLNYMLWTDESLFTREGMFNAHNWHYWSDQNPYEIRNRAYQHRWKVNIWAGIVDEKIVGPYLIPDYLNGENYAIFLQNVLPELLEEVPLHIRQRMWFMQDGCPAHSTRRVRNILNRSFPNRWLGRYGPIRWPPRSPDLTPVDFFLWGYVKDITYINEPRNPEEVIARIHASIMNIDAAMLRRIRNDIIVRATACIEAGGGNFEHLL